MTVTGVVGKIDGPCKLCGVEFETHDFISEVPGGWSHTSCEEARRSLKESTVAEAAAAASATESRLAAKGALTFWSTAKNWHPFVESDSCDITGPGHQDKNVFLESIRAYDELHGGSEFTVYSVDQIAHTFVLLDGDDSQEVAEGYPGAVPVTTLWGVR